MPSNGKPPQAYNPTGQAGADQQYQQQSANTGGWASSIPNSVIPQYQSLVTAQANNPGAAGAMATANQVAQLGQGVGQNDLTMASGLQAGGQTALGAAGQVLNTGFDPQQALYNRTLQQTTDSTNANNAAYGLSNSPYGAGVADQANSNFNIDWQNQQLSRQLQALSGYDSTLGAAGNVDTQAGALGSQGLNTIFDSGMLPYQTDTQINQNNLGMLNSATQGEIASLQPGFQQQASDLGYLGVGQGATGLNQNAWKMNAQQNDNVWSGIGNIVGGIFGGGYSNPFKGITQSGGSGGGASGDPVSQYNSGLSWMY